MLSGTMSFSASLWPALVKRWVSTLPDVSVSFVRESEMVNTAMLSGMNSLFSFSDM